MREKALSTILPNVLAVAVALMFLSAPSDATVRVLHSFVPSPPGFGPSANVIQDTAGNLYGTTETDGKYGLGSVFKLEPGTNGEWRKSVIYSFAGGNDDGSTPVGGLIFDSAGNLYGTTASGGNGVCDCGTVFKLSLGQGGTWTESILYDFQPPPDGSSPIGNLVMDANGNLYGVTPYGGTGEGGSGGGIVFELSPTAQGLWTETIIHTFQGGADGALPLAGLTFDPQGNLYGTTSGESNRGAGTVFKLTLGSNGTWSHSVLYTFDANNTSTQSSLIFDSAGNVYGTALGGPGVGCDGGGCGLAFELTPNSNGSWTYNTLYVFEGGPDGASPAAGLVFDQAGNLYGTTEYGGTPPSDCESGCGTVFELSPGSKGKWQEKVIYRFAAGMVNGFDYSGVHPVASLILDQAGNLYGTTEFGGSPRFWGGTVFELSAKAGASSWAGTVLYNFGRHKDGAQPLAALVADSHGSLYGTNPIGGSGGGCSNYGCGTVFKVARSGNGWKERVIYNFTGGQDGSGSESSLVLDPAGSLYGTALAGGLQQCPSYYGQCGTVFKLTPQAHGTWKETSLYQFTGGLDGANPISGLTLDAEGNIYGTTTQGGSCSAWRYGCGTVFELTPSGQGYTEKVLYLFAGGSDGMSPSIPLLLDSAGNLYGATDSTVFELTPNSGGGWTETILYSVAGVSGLIFDNVGNLYGTTLHGGKNDGTVFELSPSSNGTWAEKVLYEFNGTRGAGPTGITFDAAGVLYGSTKGGGSHDNGVIFSLTSGSNGNWIETVLFKFGGKNGRTPNGPLVLDSSGNLFGTTSSGGVDDQGVSQGSGVVFEYSPSDRRSGDDSQVPEVHSDPDRQSTVNDHHLLSQRFGARTMQNAAKEAQAK